MANIFVEGLISMFRKESSKDFLDVFELNLQLVRNDSLRWLRLGVSVD